MPIWLTTLLCILGTLIVMFVIMFLLFGLIYRALTRYCPKHWRMDGKTVIVTGASSGLGKETALDLARRGARVIMACRNLKKAQAVADSIIAESGNADVVVRQLELSDFGSVRKFADQINEEEAALNVLVNNAGILGSSEKKMTSDGHELTMATNHYGPFLLTLLLLKKLKSSAASRIINLSSSAYIGNQLDVTDINFVRRKYSFARAYSQSKLANILFTKELAERLSGIGVVTNSVHPGLGNTELLKDPQYRDFLRRVVAYFSGFVCRTPEQTAQTQIYLAVSEEGGEESGCHYSNCQKDTLYFDGNNMQLANQLWTASCKAVKLTPEETVPEALVNEFKHFEVPM